MPPIIDKEKCIGCTKCSERCPLDVFGPSQPGQPPIVRYPEECWHCRACVLECPADAIDMRYPLPLMLMYDDAKLVLDEEATK